MRVEPRLLAAEIAVLSAEIASDDFGRFNYSSRRRR
jgi:hypothetical protein